MYRGENNRTRSPLLCEVLEAREKLNIVLSSWETFEDLRKCWTSLHESKLYVLWTLFMLDKLRYGKLIEPKTA